MSWGAHAQVIVETGKRNYTAGDALQLLTDLGLEQQVAVLDLANLVVPLSPPLTCPACKALLLILLCSGAQLETLAALTSPLAVAKHFRARTMLRLNMCRHFAMAAA